MKKLLNLSLLLLLFVAAVSCSNDDDRTSTVLIERSYLVSDDQNITIDLGPLGNKTLTSIVIEPSNAEISRIQMDEATGDIEYFYKPVSGFNGEEIIRIETESGPLGDPDSKIIARYNFTIEVVN